MILAAGACVASASRYCFCSLLFCVGWGAVGAWAPHLTVRVELVLDLKVRSPLCTACLCWVRRPGLAPAGEVLVLCFAKEKYPKERRPPVCDPFAERRGKPASSRLRGAPWNSLCAARAARTTTASQFTKHGRCDAHATPQPPRRRRSQQGWDSRTAEQSTRAIAALGLAVAARSACAIQAERSDGPWGCPVAGSLLCVPRSAGQGVVRVPKDTRTS